MELADAKLTLEKHEREIEELQIAITKQDKIIHSGPILVFENSLHVLKDLVKDFEGVTVTSYARKLSKFLWPGDELTVYRIVDENAPDRSGQTDRIPFSPNYDLEAIENLKSN